ncbi:MAG: LemA family protein [Burkholderiaceae bacterium]
MRSILRALIALAIVGVMSGCGYNTIVTQEQTVNAAWSEVLNQYQRRADLIPNIVETVKGEANFEQTTLQNVIEARAKATSIQATPELINNPQAFQQFTQAQGQLTSALSRLLVTVENYPNLKANAAFQDLRTQLEGTENRIAIARKRYIDAVAQYNTTIALLQNFLGKILTGASPKPQFAVADEGALKQPPKVDFGTQKK